ncbi:hypothetical protein B0A48_02107 [Cryoendolithus antarcticus]|uniref:Nucleotide-diphospho-sugar transferase domain-containing protein n=1 Tax=Cryoendolithus antarcticus TaxID=1507870 RepID=A0A1V8TMQ1_9PEZI|nr:hypothetical protein B0A48_02107 [Cryoendolithus antarcticus]
MAPHLRELTFTCVFVLLLSSLGYFTWNSSHVSSFSYDARQGHTHADSGLTASGQLQSTLQYIFGEGGFSVTEPSFNYNGATYNISNDPIHTTPLGNDILILDVDTRPFSGNHQIFHETNFDWSKLEPHSGGIVNHYMYAQTHGYAYQYLQLPNPTDRSPTWVKVAGLLQTLPNYKHVVFLDADALFAHMHIPIEWLLNYWSIDSTTSFAMALDPPGIENEDSLGRRHVNTGFIIAQNNPKTFEILEAWQDCPTEERWPGCARWRGERFHEQSAFGEYVRYDYEEYVKELPCTEANGEWDLDICRGVFVQHRWWRTAGTRQWVGEQALQKLMERVHEGLMREHGNGIAG